MNGHIEPQSTSPVVATPALQHRPIPWYLRSVSSALARAGQLICRMEPEALKRKAILRTGVRDFAFGDCEAKALQILCDSANNAPLHGFGRVGIHDMLLSALVNRLLYLQAIERNEHQVEALVNPLLVVGLPRSGTTILHRLLALSDDARALRTWEVQLPLAARPRLDWRQAKIRWQLRCLHAIVPELRVKHPIEVGDAEEDFWLLNPSLMSATFFVFAPLEEYETWSRLQDMHVPYRLWANLLAILQRDTPDKRLVLKAPAHTPFLAEIRAALPNIQFVQIHRDPVPVVASLNSLMYTLTCAVAEAPDPAALGQRSLQRLQWMLERNLAVRGQLNPPVIDVHYEALVADPVATIRTIHERANLPFTRTHRQRIESYLTTRGQHAAGKHRYALQQCRLSKADVDTAFAVYIDQFRAMFGSTHA